jgi:hypothetical protein
MSWSTPVARVRATDASGVTKEVGAMVTCTVQLASGRLRMYGITEGAVIGDDDPDQWKGLVGPPVDDVEDPTWSAALRILYLDSDDDGVFEIDVSDPDKKLQNTAIPAVKDGERAADWCYAVTVYGDTDPATLDDGCSDASNMTEQTGNDDLVGITILRDMRADLRVTYKDPVVIALPDGQGWLMVLARCRQCEDDQGLGPDECISDLVAYWAPDASDSGATFEDVQGPYWLARTMGCIADAVPDAEDVRFWLGVPGVAMMGADTLVILYACERHDYTPFSVSYANSSDFEDVFEGLSKVDRVNRRGSGDAMFQCCLGCLCISLKALLDRDYANEQEWASTASGDTYKVPGVRRIAYVWQDDGAGGLDDLVELEPWPKLADPQFGLCGPGQDDGPVDPADVRLFFAGILRSDAEKDTPLADQSRDRFGIWVARPLLTEEVKGLSRRPGDSTTTDSVLGVDWLVGSAPFLPAVVHGGKNDDYQTYYDPDPVLIDPAGDDVWRVAASFQYPGEDPDSLQIESEGEHDDGCDPDATDSAATARTGDFPGVGPPQLDRESMLARRRARRERESGG